MQPKTSPVTFMKQEPEDFTIAALYVYVDKRFFSIP